MIRSRLFGTRRRKVASLLVAFMLLATAAYAAWLLSSTGDVFGRTGQLQQLSFADVSSPTTDPLFPGQTGDLEGSITNANGPMTITAAAFNGGAVTTPNEGACSSSNFTPIGRSDLSIPLPVGTTTVVLPGVISLASGAPSTCQGVVFRVQVTLTATP